MSAPGMQWWEYGSQYRILFLHPFSKLQNLSAFTGLAQQSFSLDILLQGCFNSEVSATSRIQGF